MKEEQSRKNTFLLYKDKREIIERLTDEQAGKLFKAIYKYVDTQELTELEVLVDVVFLMFKQTLDANEEKYISVVERNRKNGSKGGRPKKDKNPKNPVGFKKTQKTL